MIQFIEHKNIDKQKWDKCIDQSIAPSVSGYSWYLDILCPNWSALVLNDYQSVFPISVKSKFTIKYLLQPTLLRCLSIYSKNELTEKVVNDFFDALPKNIKLIDFYLKENTPFNREDYIVSNRNFQALNLNADYELINKSYCSSVLKNLRKAEKANFSIIDNVSANTLTKLYKENIGGQIKSLNREHFSKVEKLIAASMKNGCGITIGVLNENKEVVATSFFIRSEKIILFLIGTANKQGRANGAMGFMVDEIIKRTAQQYQIFDFGGSDIQGIANFNRNFGAKDFVYLHVKKNTLPAIVKRISRKS